jgi:hypothetical protein
LHDAHCDAGVLQKVTASAGCWNVLVVTGSAAEEVAEFVVLSAKPVCRLMLLEAAHTTAAARSAPSRMAKYIPATQPDLMSMVAHDAKKMVSTTAGFHRYHARRHAGGELDHAVSIHPSPHDDVSGAVQTNHAAAGLPQVDPENRDLHWNAPFPPIARLSLRCRVEGRAIP